MKLNSWWPKIVTFGELFLRLTAVISSYLFESFFVPACTVCLPVSFRLITSSIHNVYPPQLDQKVSPSQNVNIFQTNFFREGSKITQLWFQIYSPRQKVFQKINRIIAADDSSKNYDVTNLIHDGKTDGQTLWRHNWSMSHQ